MDKTDKQEILDAIAALARIVATKDELAEVKADVAVLKADGAILKADVAVLKADGAILKADGATLKADVREIKHIVAANHFKVIGRIDQVASMLADHMADGHHDAAE